MTEYESLEVIEFEIKRRIRMAMIGGPEYLREAAALSYILGAALEQLAREKGEGKSDA